MAIQISWKMNGKCDVYSMNPGNFRTNKDASKYYYCEAWVSQDGKPNPYPQKHSSFKEFDKFNPQIRTGVQILFYKVPFLSVVEFEDLYPVPNYRSVIQDIETDIEITNFHYSNLKNGMSASSIVSLFNGEPEPEERKKIAKLFKNHHTGSSNAGKFLLNFVDKGGTPADIKNITTSDMDKMFELLAKRLQQNIFTGHKFDPILGGIMQEGQLGGAKEILEKFDKFMKTYVQYRQQIHLELIKMIGALNGVNLDQLEVKQVSPISFSKLDPQVIGFLTPDEIRDELGLLPKEVTASSGATAIRDALNTMSPLVATKVLEAMTPDEVRALAGLKAVTTNPLDDNGMPVVSQQDTSMVNSNLSNLTGRQYQGLMRIVRDYDKGKLNKEQALLMMSSGYGLSRDEAMTFLNIADEDGQAFNSDKALLIESLFEKYAIDDNTEDEIISEEFVHIKDRTDALENEFKAVRKFAADNTQSQVLELLKGDPTLTAEKIAKQLGLEKEAVNKILETLVKEEAIILGDVISVTPKGLERKAANVEYETYTVYQYVTRPDVPEAESSRSFCKRLLKLSNDGKRWTKDAIDNISNALGENAWTYRGGFYTNPDTLETTPYCRHCWKSVTKTRRKK
jgi:DNA-binding Lrp family transcriptional regulator